MKKGRIVWLFLFFLILFCTVPADAKEGSYGRVLFISSYDYSFNTVPSQMKGIEEALDKDVLLNYEFMDTKSVNDEKSIALFHDRLSYKLEKTAPYDVVIVGDDAALQFVIDYREELFSGIPVVFEGINDTERAKTAAADGLTTGVIEQIPYKENLELAASLYPDADRIVAITDDSISGLGEIKEFQNLAESYTDFRFEELNASLYSKKEFAAELEKFDKHTIVIFLICSEDKDGNAYTNREVEEMIKEHANVPIFRVVQEGVGNGFFGGAVVSFEDAGQLAGEMAMKILEGTEPSEIAMVESSTNLYYFDEEVVNRYHIIKTQLPKKAEFVNAKVSLLEKNAHVIVGILVVALILSLVIGIVVILIHLEDRNRANEAKTIFLSRMSHEIRTPMNAILGITSLTKQATDDEKVLGNLDKIEGASKLLLSILNDVLDMSAIENGKLKIGKESFHLETALTPAVELYETLCAKKGIAYTVKYEGEVPELLLGDALRLNQILNNLLSNAFKFTKAGGTVNLTIRPVERVNGTVYIQFEVQDTGCGMSEDMKQRIFQPFEQESAKTAFSHGGSGLGMAITKNLTELMNGTIQVESKKGEGTAFTVQIPFEVAENEADVQIDRIDGTASETAYDLQGVHILLADDTELNLDVARELLELAGADVDCAKNGQEAVDKFKASAEGTYDMILMDVQMPVINGYQATEQIRNLERQDAKDIPILAMTANAFTEDIEASKQAGMDDHISKPIDTIHLYAKIEQYCHTRTA